MDTRQLGRSLPKAPTTPGPHRSPGRHQAGAVQLRAWVGAAALGDADAFTQFYSACQPWVLARCRARLSVHDAQDACAEVFARAWRHLHAGKRIEHPLAWLATVTRHLIIDHHRRARRTVTSGDPFGDDNGTGIPDPQPDPADIAAGIDVAPVVQAWLADLSPAEHTVVTGYLRADTPATTSTRTGSSLPAVRSRLYRARRKLRARLVARGLPCPPVGRC